MPCQIEINEINLKLHIGCHDAEKSLAQDVSLSVKIYNYQLFKASKTDQLEDTIDVSEVKKIIHAITDKLEVNTLERLGSLLEEGLKNHFHHTGLTWKITLTKKNYSWKYVQSWAT